MPVLKWMQSSGLGGPRIGGLRILILVLPINHWDIAKSLAAVDKKKKSLELLGYTALYIFIHKQELPVLLEFFFSELQTLAYILDLNPMNVALT